jgi:chorismate mutase/prephenate dehydratase
MFYIDLEGHRKDAAVATVLKELKNKAFVVRVLGSYPRAVL